MLVVTLKKDGRIMIGDNITIMVVQIDSNKVQIGVDAPRDVSVRRSELTPKKVADNP